MDTLKGGLSMKKYDEKGRILNESLCDYIETYDYALNQLNLAKQTDDLKQLMVAINTMLFYQARRDEIYYELEINSKHIKAIETVLIELGYAVKRTKLGLLIYYGMPNVALTFANPNYKEYKNYLYSENELYHIMPSTYHDEIVFTIIKIEELIENTKGTSISLKPYGISKDNSFVYGDLYNYYVKNKIVNELINKGFKIDTNKGILSWN